MVLVFGVVVLYLASVAIHIARGHTETLPVSQYQVRLQVLNGCKTIGLAAKVADQLADYSRQELSITVVDVDNFDLKKIEHSFVLSREPDLAGARALAARLRLDPNSVRYQPLENNYRQVTATLVLGEDWAQAMDAFKAGKE